MISPLIRNPLIPPIQGITYENWQFSEPTLFQPRFIPPYNGLYVILVRDETCSPRPYRLLYIGESENLNTRVTTNHEKHSDWTREAKGKPLFVAYHAPLGLTTSQRKELEERLIKKYDPPCNVLLRRIAPPVFPWR